MPQSHATHIGGKKSKALRASGVIHGFLACLSWCRSHSLDPGFTHLHAAHATSWYWVLLTFVLSCTQPGLIQSTSAYECAQNATFLPPNAEESRVGVQEWLCSWNKVVTL